MKKGFTLIELLAVIIILAIIALIATPIVLEVIDSAKESGRKSSVAGYADAVKLSVNEKIFETKGSSPVIDEIFLSNLDYQGERVTCDEVKNASNYGVILKTCKVEKSENIYCFAKGKVYNCDDTEFNDIYNNIKEDINIPAYLGFNEEKGVNSPQLLKGMTPIKWVNGVETVTTKDDIDWYDYTKKMWANAKTADGSYWVWIPRYAYKITSGYHHYSVGTIDVVFLKNDTIENINNTEIKTTGYNVNGTNTNNAYFLEPAFQNETNNTKYGFWVAKFEMSNTIDLPKTVPNAVSLRRVTIGDMFTISSNMTSDSSYGWNNGMVDTHLMTNYEWGATAYLSKSNYGKNSEVWINNSSQYITGCSGPSVSAKEYSGCEYAYGTPTANNASTTGNITGVFDMSGGSDEYVSAYIDSGKDLTQYGNSIVTSTINKNIYGNIENIYGDAVYEIGIVGGGAWNADYFSMPTYYYPWFHRGGNSGFRTLSGLFSLSGTDGDSSSSFGFRVIASQGQ